jgi:plasmid maintenance system antidote protein VapI
MSWGWLLGSARSAGNALGGLKCRVYLVTRQQLHNVVSGRSAVSPEMAVRFEKAFGGAADMWLRMQAAFDLAEVRRREGEIHVARLKGAER